MDYFLLLWHGAARLEELKKEHDDFLAGSNKGLQRSCLGASAESQRL